MYFKEELCNKISECPFYKGERNGNFYFVDGQQEYFISLTNNPCYPVHWSKYNFKGNDEKSSYPAWLKRLYFDINEIYFENQDLRALLDKNKKRPAFNLAYVYACLYGEQSLIGSLDAAVNSVRVDNTEKKFKERFKERLVKEAYNFKILENEIKRDTTTFEIIESEFSW